MGPKAKDFGPKAKDFGLKANDFGLKAKDLSTKATAKDLGPKAKAKASRCQSQIFHRSFYIIFNVQVLWVFLCSRTNSCLNCILSVYVSYCYYWQIDSSQRRMPNTQKMTIITKLAMHTAHDHNSQLKMEHFTNTNDSSILSDIFAQCWRTMSHS